MPSTITVTVKYDDGSKSLALEYPCADSLPPADVLADCERDAVQRWETAGNSLRGLAIHTKVKRTK